MWLILGDVLNIFDVNKNLVCYLFGKFKYKKI